MMRITTLVFVCASIAGCSWGGSDDGGGGGGGPDAAVAAAPVCGDSVCAASEVGNCASDCGNSGSNNPTTVCGNNSCETGETQASCPNDCTGGGSGSGSGGGSCPANVTDCALCAIVGLQCPTGLDMAACTACLGSGGGGLGDLGCTGMMANGTCDANEDSTTCPSDCP